MLTRLARSSSWTRRWRRPEAAFTAHEAGRARLVAARLTHRLGVGDEPMSVEYAKRLADRLGAVLLVLSARYENDAVVGFTAYVFCPDGCFEVRHLDDTGDPSAEAAEALRRLRVEQPISRDLRADLLSELVTGALHDELSVILVAPDRRPAPERRPHARRADGRPLPPPRPLRRVARAGPACAGGAVSTHDPAALR